MCENEIKSDQNGISWFFGWYFSCLPLGNHQSLFPFEENAAGLDLMRRWWLAYVIPFMKLFFAQTRDTFLAYFTACPSVCLSLSVVTRGLTTYTQRNEKCPLIDVATTAAPAAGLLYSASFG